MNYLKKIVDQTAIYGISSVLGRVLNYFLVPFYTYTFSPKEYGVVTDLYSIVAIFIVILTYGIETSIFRFLNKNEKDEKKVISTAFTSILITSIIFILISLTFRNNIADFAGYSNHKQYISYFILILGIDSFLSVPFAYLRQKNKAKLFSIIKFSNILINIGFNVFFIVVIPYFKLNFFWYKGVSVEYIFISNLIASIFTFILLFPIVYKFKIQLDLNLLKKMLTYGFPIMIAGLAGIINEMMDRQFLKYLLPKDIALREIGIYGACYKITIFMTLFIQAFRMGVEPFLFQKYKDNDAKKVYSNIMYYFVIVVSFIYLIINTNIDIIKYFIGEDFREGLKIVPIVLLANLFLGIYFNLSVWYKVIDKTFFGMIFSLIGVIFTVSINIIFIPKFGYIASAWATLSAYFSMMIISYFVGKNHYKISYDTIPILSYIIVSIILSVIYINTKKHILSIIFNLGFLILAFYKEKLWIWKIKNKNQSI